jgi:hypothetical protein
MRSRRPFARDFEDDIPRLSGRTGWSGEGLIHGLTTKAPAINAFYEHPDESARFGWRGFERSLLDGLIQLIRPNGSVSININGWPTARSRTASTSSNRSKSTIVTAPVITGHIVADADRSQFDFAEPLDVANHLTQMRRTNCAPRPRRAAARHTCGNMPIHARR